MRTVLFVCTGNTCRSPMAESIARKLVRDGGIEGLETRDVLFISAGIAACDGAPASPEVEEVLAARGIRDDHRSHRLTPEMAGKADLILTMTRSHLDAVHSLLEGAADDPPEVMMLDPDGDILDPIGCGLEVYRSTADQMAGAIPRRLGVLVP